MKEPRVGGAWTWHQDYGYWYQNGVLFPLLTSVSIAVDPASKENGCLQVIHGSHELGRIDHILTGEHAGAGMERVGEVLKRPPLEYVEMEPGDALFFHPNLLHRSDQNRSENPRWSMICCYNAARLIESVLDGSEKHWLPIYAEMHRATIFQDNWRTVQFVRRFPELRFNGDFSHWYTGSEMAYGGFENKLRFIAPVLERIRFVHGCIRGIFEERTAGGLHLLCARIARAEDLLRPGVSGSRRPADGRERPLAAVSGLVPHSARSVRRAAADYCLVRWLLRNSKVSAAEISPLPSPG